MNGINDLKKITFSFLKKKILFNKVPCVYPGDFDDVLVKFSLLNQKNFRNKKNLP